MFFLRVDHLFAIDHSRTASLGESLAGDDLYVEGFYRCIERADSSLFGVGVLPGEIEEISLESRDEVLEVPSHFLHIQLSVCLHLHAGDLHAQLFRTLTRDAVHSRLSVLPDEQVVALQLRLHCFVLNDLLLLQESSGLLVNHEETVD